MSFGPNNSEKAASNNLAGTSNLALNTAFPAEEAGAGSTLASGQQNTGAASGYFNTLLGGNQANTAALLQPQINQVRGSNQAALQSLSTLMPRGGGRSGTLFGTAYAPQSQIGGLFNQARSAAGPALGQLGLGQENVGANLFNAGNSSLGAATGANSANLQYQLQQQQMTNQLYAGLGSALFGLATGGVGGGLGGLFGGAASGAADAGGSALAGMGTSW